MDWKPLVNNMTDEEFKELKEAVDLRAPFHDHSYSQTPTEEEKDIWKSRDKMRAIKSFRIRTGWGLRESYDLFKSVCGV